MEVIFQPFINFYNNLISGDPIVYIILFVVLVSLIVAYKDGIRQINVDRYWRNKK